MIARRIFVVEILFIMLAVVFAPVQFVKADVSTDNITDWSSEDHGARIFIKFPVATELSGDVNNCPIILKFISSDDDFWSNRGDDDGDDAKFYGLDANGTAFGNTATELDYEVLEFNASSYTYIVAVNVLHFEDSDTQNFIFMYTDYDGEGDFDNPTDVWGATAKYIGNFVTDASDSSVNANHGVVSGATLEANSSYLGGACYYFGGDGDKITLDTIDFRTSTTIIQFNPEFDDVDNVLGVLIKHEAGTSRDMLSYVVTNSGSGDYKKIDNTPKDDANNILYRSSVATVIDGVNYGFFWVNSGSYHATQLNANTKYTNNHGKTILTPNTDVIIGTLGITNNDYKGRIGFVWIFSEAKSDDWVKAVYNNQKNYSNFVSTDAETKEDFDNIKSTTWNGITGLTVGMLPDITEDLSGVSDLGVDMIMMDLYWNKVETVSGVYDFDYSFYKWDTKVDALNSNGQEVVLRLAYSNGLYSSPPGGMSDTDKAYYVPTDPSEFETFKEAYGNYVYESVNHFKGKVTYFTIYSEPDGFWLPGATREERTDAQAIQYVELLKEGYTRAKEANPSCIILSAPIYPSDAMVNLYIPKFYSEGAKDYFDILAVDPYCDVDYVFPTANYGLYETCSNLQNVEDIYTIMVANDDGDKDIWITETGYPTFLPWANDYILNENTQRVYMQNLFGELNDHFPYVKAVFWYNYFDGSSGYGLVEIPAIFSTEGDHGEFPAGTPKPAYYTYQSLEKTFVWPTTPVTPTGGGTSGGTPSVLVQPPNDFVTVEDHKQTRLADIVKAVLDENLPSDVSASIGKYVIDPVDWLAVSAEGFFDWLWNDFFAFSSQESVIPLDIENAPSELLEWGLGSVGIDVPLLGRVTVPRIAVLLVAGFLALQMLGSKPKKKRSTFAKQMKRNTKQIEKAFGVKKLKNKTKLW